MIALFVVLTISSGLGFYNLTLYMTTLALHKGFPVGDLSWAIGIFFLSGGVAGIWVGHLLATQDARLVILGGAAAGGLSLGLMPLADELWQLYLLYGLFGIGNTSVSLIPATTLVTRFFPGSNRSLALSIASTGLSLGGVILTPLSAYLLTRFGLSFTLPYLGVTYFLGIGGITWFFVHSWPEDEHPSISKQAVPVGAEYHEALRSRFFVGLTLAYVLVMAAQVGGIAHIFGRGLDVSDELTASLGVSVLAGMSIIGRLIGGWVVAQFSIRSFAFMNLGGQAAGLALIAGANTDTTFLSGAGVFGFTVGNLLMLQPLLLAEAFGVRDYPRIFSTNQAITMLGVAGGPVLLGWLHDSFSYAFAFAATVWVSAMAVVVLIAAGPIPVSGSGSPRNPS